MHGALPVKPTGSVYACENGSSTDDSMNRPAHGGIRDVDWKLSADRQGATPITATENNRAG